MGWFEEQLNTRRQNDADSLSEALETLAGSVMGRRVRKTLDQSSITHNAVQECVKYFGFKVREIEIPDSVTDMDTRLELLLRPYGILRRNVTLDKGWYRHAAGPMIGLLKETGDTVALIPGRFSGYYLMDFSSGTSSRVSADNEELLSEEAICLYRPLPLRSIGIRDLFLFMADQLSVEDILLFAAALALPVLLGLLTPLFSKWLFGVVLQTGSMRLLVSLAVFMLCFLMTRLLVNVFRELILARTNTRLDVAVRSAVMGRVLQLKPEFFKDYSAGELTSRISGLDILSTCLTDTIGFLGITAVFSMIYIGQAAAFAPAMARTALITTLITFCIIAGSAAARSRIYRRVLYEASKADGMTYPMICGIQKIRASGAESRMFSRWAEQYAKETSLKYNLPLFLKLSPALELAVSLAGSILLYRVALREHVSLENYYAFTAAFGMVSAAFAMLSQMILPASNILPVLKMAEPILKAEPEQQEDRFPVMSLNGGIELKNVSFRYEENQPYVIDDLSLKIKPGEYVAIVGRTGSGKSTVLRLLLGFETPQKGSIYYDRKDLASMDLRSLRRKIGTVMQDGRLFIGSIYSNIVITSPLLTIDDAWKAAEMAGIAEDIRRLPMGMHTMVGEGFGGLSGGQRQRIIIARALAAGPKILFFDEATSALDNITQKKISDELDCLQCTRLVIAHRLSTIRNCDRIVVMDRGRIVEQGSYEELMKAQGAFSELVARQQLDYQEPEEKI